MKHQPVDWVALTTAIVAGLTALFNMLAQKWSGDTFEQALDKVVSTIAKESEGHRKALDKVNSRLVEALTNPPNGTSQP